MFLKRVHEYTVSTSASLESASGIDGDFSSRINRLQNFELEILGISYRYFPFKCCGGNPGWSLVVPKNVVGNPGERAPNKYRELDVKSVDLGFWTYVPWRTYISRTAAVSVYSTTNWIYFLLDVC